MKKIFISYRRQDSGASARRIAADFASRYGATNVFMDTDTIRAGDNWQERINTALRDAGIVLAVIGPQWLHSHDADGRRRIDNEADWVRNELIQGLDGQRQFLPVLVQGATPVAESALPQSLQRLASIQNYPLSDTDWQRDIDELFKIVEGMGAKQVTLKSALMAPAPLDKSPPLDQATLDAFLRETQWTIFESTKEVPGSIRETKELARTYYFKSFADCIHFMGTASRQIDIMDHHPRWENTWINLRVFLSSWDIGGLPTYKDTRLAKYLDELYIGYMKAEEREAAGHST